MVLILPYFSTIPSHARWATYEDASAEIEFLNSDIVVDKDGKTIETVEKQIKILKESGRNSFGVERIHFNENIEKIDIIEAKTIIDGKEFIVPKNMIEIKPLASEINAFDQLFQIFISYPHINVGSRIYLKYKNTITKQPLRKYFAVKFYYGSGTYWKEARFTVKSELPFKMIINDPHDELVVKEYKEGPYYNLRVTSKKPTYRELTNESTSTQIPESLKTWVELSTFDSFEKFATALSKDYEDVLQQKLPPLQESIRQEAAKVTHPVDQINTVTSLLADKIRYMGDWRTIEGRLSPRSLKTVAESGVGDCKDFSASTCAILNVLGYKAKVAIVFRGLAYLTPEKSLPSFLNTNHAIVKAIDKSGKIYWIDPTNFTSMADGIYPDIAERPALVLDSKNSSYEQIPPIDANHSKIISEDIIEIKDGDILSDTGFMEFFGEQAIDSTGAGLIFSLQSIEEALVKELTGETTPIKKKISIPPLNSRFVKNFKIDYAFEQDHSLLLTNEGLGFLLKASWAHMFLDTSPSQIGTLFVSSPLTLIKKAFIKNMKAKQVEVLNFQFKSPWLEAKREFRVNSDGIELKEQVSILKSFITADDIKSKQYKDLKDFLKKYCRRSAMIMTKIDSKKIN